MVETTLLINGESRPASNGAYFERLSPLNEQVASKNAAATIEDVSAAVEAAAAAFPSWSALGPTTRRTYLLKAADIMDSYKDEFMRLGVAEAGGTPGWYGFNAMLAANMLREAASMTTLVQGQIIPSDVPGNLALGVRQACGVVVGIAPWNAPLILGTRAVCMPLACGNTVILKASELTPAMHRLIGTVFVEAGFPPGVVNVITNAPEDAPVVVESLIAHPLVKRVNFTGSTQVGRIIGTLAAQHFTPAILELGGKNPMLVFEDADLNQAVQAAAFGAFFNQGQICMSTDRLIVHESVADEFLSRLTTKLKELETGLPNVSQAALGAMVSEAAAQRIEELVEDALNQGAKQLTGPTQRQGVLVEPILLDAVTPDMRLYKEEAFGPVVTVLRFNDQAEAIRLANDSEYGLSASIFSGDISRAMHVAQQIESGICHINSSTVHDEAQMPFGGVKASGYGRFGSQSAIEAFTDLRWMTIQTTPRQYPI
ncbi:aldehyde dehydrogenase [Paenalcaligenes hominis]|uniref:aldehyde dehydrogenase n=1 Tax=Paenalcaligenes hominis TaxID=643674 RepID=UPI0035264F4B